MCTSNIGATLDTTCFVHMCGHSFSPYYSWVSVMTSAAVTCSSNWTRSTSKTGKCIITKACKSVLIMDTKCNKRKLFGVPLISPLTLVRWTQSLRALLPLEHTAPSGRSTVCLKTIVWQYNWLRCLTWGDNTDRYIPWHTLCTWSPKPVLWCTNITMFFITVNALVYIRIYSIYYYISSFRLMHLW